jgi:hypothetical protein
MLILEHGFHEEQSSAGVGFNWNLIGELTAEDCRVLDEMREMLKERMSEEGEDEEGKAIMGEKKK